MSKFNRPKVRAAVSSPIVSQSRPSARTHEGGAGYARDAEAELFLLAVTNMVGENTFYEPAAGRDSRFVELVHQVAVDNPQWIAGFLPWLRREANMRSASLVAGLEAAKAMLGAQVPGGRQIVASVLQRADEPGEALAYWMSRYGRAVPKPVKRGIADAALRLYAEYPLLKYDTPSHGFRFADVLELCHPGDRKGSSQANRFKSDWQKDLFEHAIDRRQGRNEPTPASLRMLRANEVLRRLAGEDPSTLLDADRLREAGMTWEDVLSLAGSRLDKARLWEVLAPSMGYMALLRNLRNFDDAAVSDLVAKQVGERLSDPQQVARSRQLPMRFLSAYRAAPSLRWSYPLEQALGHALDNIPALPGRTLILVDTSTSMNGRFSKDGTLMRWDAAVIFGVALAQRCTDADVVSFSSSARYWGDPDRARTKVFSLERGESLLRSIDRWKAGGWFLGGGTATAAALRKHYAGHDRVVILTDEQANSDGAEVSESVPAQTPLVTFNLAGYRYGHAPSGSGTRVTVGGLTDAGFRLIPLLESGRDGTWPWEEKPAV